ncbi:Uncharacterized protein DAT39_021505 [Clarias magur]|uniref:Uncharacterized protein n=1 Tax=Clarias magur TaxID=1594786 RepID=A0A8J4U175_CLAMG|nr:Uncharacterized protein DAT39_021505 [Clarias magur]
MMRLSPYLHVEVNTVHQIPPGEPRSRGMCVSSPSDTRLLDLPRHWCVSSPEILAPCRIGRRCSS